ncbi:riboflavin synthase subunit alpha [Novosphingobium indicum]|uniref:Riboflavin synthase n=1 Tax=Novosphingobium indicum TaxID=462949 RepID=A0ABQ2JSV3_9SPHN|nr:riboflavin synthase [Novosphingobium indicum]GGN52883.1 riboflavin synthase subunit alpha [Novosphingobium indicum]
MFTGIVTAVGTIRETRKGGDLRLVVACPFDPAGIAMGASIACSGVCLTVVDRGGEAGNAWFAVDLSGESVARTVAGRWEVGNRLNLEPALKLGDELGGHIVTGHVDGVGKVVSVTPDGDSKRFVIAAPKDLAPYLAPKGSITVDGVSLTVNEVADQPDGTCHFTLNIIPHTAEVTTIGALQAGDGVNLEIDVLARYLQRMQSLRG